MKRGNDKSQLRAEEVEALNDEESEEAGTFKRANKEVLQQRKIYKISRNTYEHKDSTSGAAPATSAGFGLPLTATAPSVSFAKSPITDTSITHQNSASLNINSKPVTSLPINSNIKKPSSEESEQYKTEMNKLNESFLNWLNKQANENIESPWTDAMEDYIKYSNDIAEKYPTAANYFSAVSNAENNTTEKASEPIKPSTATATVAPSSLDMSTKKQEVPKPIIAPSVSTTPSVPFSSITTIPTVTAASASSGGTSTSANPFGGFSFNTTNTTAASSNTSTATDTTIKPSVATPFAGFSFSATAATTTVTAPITPVVPEEKKSATTAFAGFTGLTGFTIPKPAGTPATATGGFFNLPAPGAGGTAPVSTGFLNPFGSGTSATSTTTGGFTGFPTIPVSSSFSLPSFGSTAVTGTVNHSAGDDDGGGDDDDEGEPILEPEKILRNEEDKDIQLHEVPCKLFKFKPDSKEWGDLGKCSFRITKTPDTGRQRIIIRNLMGKPLVNAYFYKDMKLEQNKNSIKFAVFVAEEDGTKGMKSFNVKFNPAEVDNTMKILNAGVASVK